jgi:hypothetical protein
MENAIKWVERMIQIFPRDGRAEPLEKSLILSPNPTKKS